MKLTALLLLFLLNTIPSFAGRIHPEAWYQNQWCFENDGVTEVILSDQTRVDCLLADYAVEFDFADKWAESIGQALHYAGMTKRTAGVVLILENGNDLNHVNKLLSTIEAHRLNIRVWLQDGR